MKARGTIATLAWCLAAAGLLSCSAKPADPRAAQFMQLPDWRGIWITEGPEMGISGFDSGMFSPTQGPPPSQLVVLAPAPWNEAGNKRKGAAMAGLGNRKANGWGYPVMMNGPAPLQFLITPEETLIVNMYREVRHVYTDGRSHPAEGDRWPTTWGDSIGHWEGDTLVIDTVSVENPSKFFQLGPPLSEQAHYVERLRKTAPGRIEFEITIEDPATLTKPWQVKAAYTLAPGLDRMIHGDLNNDRSEVDGDVFTIKPPAN